MQGSTQSSGCGGEQRGAESTPKTQQVSEREGQPGTTQPQPLYALTTLRQVTPRPLGRVAGSNGRAGPRSPGQWSCRAGTPRPWLSAWRGRGPVLRAETMGRGRRVRESEGPGKPGRPGTDLGQPDPTSERRLDPHVAQVAPRFNPAAGVTSLTSIGIGVSTSCARQQDPTAGATRPPSRAHSATEVRPTPTVSCVLKEFVCFSGRCG